MTETTEQAVVDTPAPDAIATPPETVETEAVSSPAVTDADETTEQRPKGVQKRIDELTRLRYDAERERDHWRELAMRQQTPAKPEATELETPKALPKLEDFSYDEAAYQSALTVYLKDEAARVARETLNQERQREQEQTRKQTFRQRESEFSKSNADYMQITRDPTLPITQDVADLISESEKGPEVLFYLAKNRELAERLSGMNAVAAAREIGRIEAKLEKPAAPAVPPKPSVSQAPPPPPRIEANDGAPAVKADSPDSDKLSDSEWARLRNKQLARKK